MELIGMSASLVFVTLSRLGYCCGHACIELDTHRICIYSVRGARFPSHSCSPDPGRSMQFRSTAPSGEQAVFDRVAIQKRLP